MAIQRTSEEDRNRERKRIADELLAFRQKYLFTQVKMAEALGISRRALQYAEAGVALLQMSTRARFLGLKKQFSRGRVAA